MLPTVSSSWNRLWCEDALQRVKDLGQQECCLITCREGLHSDEELPNRPELLAFSQSSDSPHFAMKIRIDSHMSSAFVFPHFTTKSSTKSQNISITENITYCLYSIKIYVKILIMAI